jgi:4a-hydroxytetrahydrobiopterin dehydratase
MAHTITATQFHRRADRPDWRVLLGRIEATFRAPDFGAAAVFVEAVAAAAEAAGHHPDVDVRYPGLVHVSLVTHAARGLTDADVDLAGTISAIAAGAGLTSDPHAALAVEVGVDAMDIDLVRPFWKAILGYDDEPPRPPGGQVRALVDPQRIAPAVWFQQMDVPRPQRNRIHLDVTVPHDVAEARGAAAIAAGGRLLTDEYARAFWVLADPEGNEACVCTWQDRDDG